MPYELTSIGGCCPNGPNVMPAIKNLAEAKAQLVATNINVFDSFRRESFNEKLIVPVPLGQ